MAEKQKYHPLLERQLRDIPEELRGRIRSFLNDVNASYRSYDDNYYLLERASQLSFDELNTTNAALRDKAREMTAIITQLKESIAEVAGELVTGSNDAEVLLHVLRHQIELRKEAEQRTLLSEKKYRSIIEGLELGIIETDLEGKITRVYPKFTQLIGYTQDELLGKHPTELLIEPGQLDMVRDIEALRRSGESSVWETRILDKSGKVRNLLISGSPIRDVNGKVTGSIGLHFDITEHVERAEALKKAQLEAEAALRSQETFLANISHEMRTPMNAIIGLSRILERSNTDPKTADYAGAIHSSATELLTIINDVLDMARMNAGEFKLDFEPFDLTALLRRSEALFRQTANEKSVDLSYSVDPALEGGFTGDPVRINQIVTNLIGNAIKFTEKGGKVQLSASPDAKGIRIQVADTGVGIDAGRIHSIFDSFKQEDDSVTRKYGGTGLGLSITRQLTTLFGGTISVKSEKGKGSVFTITLPLERSSLKTNSEDEALHTLEGVKLLLVEDNPVNRMVAEAILRPWGCTVKAAENGAIALEMLEADAYDLVLMDLQMPVMGGFEAVKRIREELKLAIPVIALTANALPTERDACLAAGMDAYVSKPIDPPLLNQTIYSMLCGGHPASEQSDYTGLRNILEHSSKDQQSKLIAELNEGVVKQGEELLLLLESGDFRNAASKAHALRPLTELSGLNTLTRQLKLFEQAVDRKRYTLARLCAPTLSTSISGLLNRLKHAQG